METGPGEVGEEMPPELSLRLFKEGATYILLDVPPGTEVGIDMNTWNTGEKFKGIKMIPPGLHFLYFSAVSKNQMNTAPRTGFYHIFEREELLAKRYDQRMEDISTSQISTEDQGRMKAELEELDKHLGAYPYKRWRTWVSLTSRITADTLKRLCPPSGRILSAPELTLDADQGQPDLPSSSSKRMSRLEAAEKALPKMTENVESKIRYTTIPTENYPVGATPTEISKSHLDKSWKLENVINRTGKPTDFLAELQFAFVTFLVGQHYDSFEHWKALVYLLCNSDEAILKFPSLYHDFISDLYFQMKEIPEDFFVDIVTSNNLLFSCTQRLISNVREQEGADDKLKRKVDRFAAFLSSKFAWDFDEDYEDAPTIVTQEEATVSTERAQTDQPEEHTEMEEETSDNEFEIEAMDVIGDMPTF